MNITISDIVILIVGFILGILVGVVFFSDDADAAAGLVRLGLGG